MDFRTQDILKNILPGSVLSCLGFSMLVNLNIINAETFFRNYIQNASEIWLVIFICISYLLGTIIDSFSSMCEFYLYDLGIWNRPSFVLLNDKSLRYRISQKDDILNNIIPANATLVVNDPGHCYTIFKLANIKKDENPSEIIRERVGEYYNSYIFSRNLILTTIISCSLIVNMLWDFEQPLVNTFLVFIAFCLSLVMVVRWRQRAICYSRQIFYASYFN